MFFFVLVVFSQATILFSDNFGDGAADRWTQATYESASDYYGDFEFLEGDWTGENEIGAKSTEDYRHYVSTAMFDEEFDNEGKTTVIQFTLKNTQQNFECGGGYLKLGGAEDLADPKDFNSETPYSVMFGPDVCGTNKVVHLIFSYKGENLLWKKKVAPPSDKLTHIFTAIIYADNTYEVLVDGEVKESGELENDWEFLPPQEIPDPEAKKPADWVDDAKIPDPEDVKPEDWDEQPKFVSDPDAEMPEDWDEEEDGEWEAPQVPNPAYKGEWAPKMIDNPDFIGVWAAPLIENPDYEVDDELYKRKFNFAAIEVWQVRAGSIWSNVLVTDDVDEAKEAREDILAKMEKEKEVFEEQEAARREKEAEERKKMEEERKIQEEQEAREKEEEEAERLLKEMAEEDDEAPGDDL